MQLKDLLHVFILQGNFDLSHRGSALHYHLFLLWRNFLERLPFMKELAKLLKITSGHCHWFHVMIFQVCSLQVQSNGVCLSVVSDNWFPNQRRMKRRMWRLQASFRKGWTTAALHNPQPNVFKIWNLSCMIASGEAIATSPRLHSGFNLDGMGLIQVSK